jgi:chromosome segregation ATPase
VISTGEMIALAGLVSAGAGVYAALRAELARLASSFEHLGLTLTQIRDDLHEMRTELRADVQAHSQKLGDHAERIAALEATRPHP